MKILMTTDTLGGVWTYTIELLAQLQTYDIQVALASKGAHLTGAQRQQVNALSHVTLYESEYPLEWMENPWTGLAESQRWLRRIAEREQPDLLHLNEFAHGADGWPVPVLTVGHSCVLSWFEAVRHQPAGPAWERYREVVKQSLQDSDLVVAPTRAMLEALHRHYGPLPRSRVIPNGLRPLLFQAKRRKEPFVFTAGRLWDEAKNIGTLAQIADHLHWPVRVAGLPHPENPEWGLSGLECVEYLGRLAPAAMRSVYAQAAIYALPARYEPFGLTPLEAALSRCALVLGDIPSLREVWHDAAVFVDPEQPVQVARAINRLIDDHSRRREMGQRALERARRWTAPRMTQAYVQTYRRLQSVHQGRRLRQPATMEG